MSYRILIVVGARPNFVKIAPLAKELARQRGMFDLQVVHTGQHHDPSMSQVFFDELGIPTPDINLGVSAASHARQTAAIMTAIDPIFDSFRPDLALVVGDVNSTLAAALVAAKRDVEVAHVEAGLRSYDRSMPEEINRVLTDQLSTLLFTTERAAAQNLLREGLRAEQVHFVGNVMIDTLLAYRDRARGLDVPSRYGLERSTYALLTLHRPSNVDQPDVFERLMSAVQTIAHEAPVVFPVHPRTRSALLASRTAAALSAEGGLRLLDPMGYLEFVGLMEGSRAVLTDSGGIQEETTILRVPCLTLRENTERPITIQEGTNQLVGTDPARILEGWKRAGRHRTATGAPELWDGRAARRIVEILERHAAARKSWPAVHVC